MMLNQVYDANCNPIKGLYKNETGALIVINDSAFIKANAEKERLMRVDNIEQTLNNVVDDINTIKELLQTLIREKHG